LAELNSAETNEQPGEARSCADEGQHMNTNESSARADKGGHIYTAFVMLPTQLLADFAAKRLSAGAYALYAFLVFWQGTNGKLWWGIPSIAEATGLSEGTVKRYIKELVKAGHISRIKRMGANWHTVCRTYVDKTRTVFVGGKPVNRVKEAEKPTARAKIEDFLGQRAAASTEKPVTEPESVLEEMRESEEKPTDNSWMEKVPWNDRLRLRLSDYSGKHDPMKAKRLFLDEVSGESPEMEELYKAEFPDTEEITSVAEPRMETANGAERARDSLDVSPKQNSLDETQTQTDEVASFTETEEEQREEELRDAWKKKVTWTEQDQRNFDYHVKRLGYDKGKQAFLEEIKFKDVTWMDLFCREYPDSKQAKWLVASCGLLQEYRGSSKGIPAHESVKKEFGTERSTMEGNDNLSPKGGAIEITAEQTDDLRSETRDEMNESDTKKDELEPLFS